jgi:acetyl esterase/lipase
MKIPWCAAPLLLVLVPAVFAQTSPAVHPILLNVWPEGKLPGHGAPQPETIVTSGNSRRIFNVSTPTLAVYQAAGAKPAPAMIVCPGGAYGHLSYDLEGTEVATWLNSLGLTAAVLKYRVPNNRDGALQDLQRSLRLVRQHAAEWNIDPKKIGVIGFSAGGHLAARASTNFDSAAYPRLDAADDLTCRPDFVVLVYPAYLAVKGVVAPELPITARTPPTYLTQAEDDHAYVPGTKTYFAALQAAGVPSKMVLFVSGGHGFGLRSQKEAKVWPLRCQDWLRQIGVL